MAPKRFWHTWKVPLYANMICLGNNVLIASNVSFLTYNVSYRVSNNFPEIGGIQERIGCIEIGNNVFVGSGVHILYDKKIGNNVIIRTGTTIMHDIPDNCVAVGTLARVIGTFDDYVEKMLKLEKYLDEL